MLRLVGSDSQHEKISSRVRAEPVPELYGEHSTIEGIVELHAQRIQLLFGRQYQGRLLVDGVRQLTSSTDVRALVEDLGFSDVRIYMQASDLPSDWPASKRGGPNGIEQFTAFFDAVWDQSASSDMAKPSYMLEIWYVDDSGATASPTVPPTAGNPATKVVALGRHGKARQLVLAAWSKVHGPEARPTLSAAQAIQAVALHETSYGAGWTGNGVGSNNVGAIQAGRVRADGVVPDGTFVHGDKTAQGVPYQVLFRAYPTLLDGWVDLVRLLSVKMAGVAAVLDSKSIDTVARAMHDAHYYEGDATNGKDPVAGYAAALHRGLDSIVKELGEQPSWLVRDGGEPNPLRGIVALLILAGGIWYWYRQAGGVS